MNNFILDHFNKTLLKKQLEVAKEVVMEVVLVVDKEDTVVVDQVVQVDEVDIHQVLQVHHHHTELLVVEPQEVDSAHLVKDHPDPRSLHKLVTITENKYYIK